MKRGVKTSEADVVSSKTKVVHAGERRKVVSRIFASWNRIVDWFRQIDGLQQAAEAIESTTYLSRLVGLQPLAPIFRL